MVFIFRKSTRSCGHLSQPSISLVSELRWSGVTVLMPPGASGLSIHWLCILCLLSYKFRLMLWLYKFLLDVSGASRPPVASRLHHPWIFGLQLYGRLPPHSVSDPSISEYVFITASRDSFAVSASQAPHLLCGSAKYSVSATDWYRSDSFSCLRSFQPVKGHHLAVIPNWMRRSLLGGLVVYSPTGQRGISAPQSRISPNTIS
jgi:hypothetical protein